MFVKENLNPKNLNTGDCVIRAIAKATGASWDEVYEELCQIGKNKKRMPNEQLVWETYLKKKGWTKSPDKILFENGKRLRVMRLAEKFPTDTYLVKITRHLTVLKEGTIYDTWNPWDYCVYGLWVKY